MHKLFRNYFSDQDLILFEQPREYIQQASISKGQAASYDTSRIAEAKVFDPYRDLPIELLDKVQPCSVVMVHRTPMSLTLF